MEQYKKEFIEFMIDCQVLKFGDFVTKSGRKTPFFVNTGYYRTGSQLKKLGEYYAKAIHESFGSDFDVLFGPAYKGIPLSVTTAIALSDEFDTDVRYCSNRKEVKDHGDVGILLGGPINDGDRVMMIEDVTTSGKSINETMPIIQAQGNVTVTGLCVSVDRMERGTGEKSAIAELEEQKLKKGLGDDMEQKLYKTVNSAGISSIVTGIIAVVAGLACVAGGILALIQGGRLLGARKNILF